MEVPCASQPGVGAILTSPSERPQQGEPTLIQEDEDPNQVFIRQLVSEVEALPRMRFYILALYGGPDDRPDGSMHLLIVRNGRLVRNGRWV